MGFRENLDKNDVRALQLREAIVVPPTTTVRDTARKMRDKRLGCAFVTDDAGRPRGIFTEGLLTKLLSRDARQIDDPVGKHVSGGCGIISETAPISDLIRIMEANKVRYVAVTNADGRLVGLTGQRGLMEYVADYFPRQVMVARTGMKTSEREGA